MKNLVKSQLREGRPFASQNIHTDTQLELELLLLYRFDSIQLVEGQRSRRSEPNGDTNENKKLQAQNGKKGKKDEQEGFGKLTDS
jgi:hypothetical protein